MIALGSDHGGFELKESIKEYLESKNISCHDFGTCSLDAMDYTDIGYEVATAVASGAYEQAIIICGTGLGISIAANKVPGIRAAVCTNNYMARMAREHNNANILALGARVVGEGLALDIIDTWLKSSFSGAERHKARVDKITEIEKRYSK